MERRKPNQNLFYDMVVQSQSWSPNRHNFPRLLELHRLLKTQNPARDSLLILIGRQCDYLPTTKPQQARVPS